MLLLPSGSSAASCGIFPSKWKDAYIFPIHKSGNKHEVSNYRPIAILCIVSKIFDRIVAKLISGIFYDLIAKQQHSFPKGRSTLTNLLVYCDFLFSSIRQNRQIDTLNFDFSKAFDLVDHQRLLKKLWNFGIRGALFKWLQSYLIGRRYAVAGG